MSVHFRLERLEEAGLEPGRKKKKSAPMPTTCAWSEGGPSTPTDGKAPFSRTWVETRLGLLARHHHRFRVLLNNRGSLSANRERADEFGDYILEVRVPLPKIFFNLLLPGISRTRTSSW